MAKRLGGGNAFGGALGGGTSSPPVGGTLPGGAQAAPDLSKKQQKKITRGVHGDPNNPYNTNISGNITSGQGSFVANENPDDYWTWLNAKAGLQQNPQTPFGGWLGHLNDYMQSLYGAAKLDNPNLYYSNFLGSYGYGSPTQADPSSKQNGITGGGGHHKNNNQQQNSNDHGPDHKRKGGHGGRGGRKGGKGAQAQPAPSQGGQ